MELIKNPYKTVTAMKMSTAEGRARSESDDNNKNDNDSINSEGEDVILAFIDDEEEVERPATTRSGGSINRRSEIDFSFF